jgi:Cyclic nucleotide-binding domain
MRGADGPMRRAGRVNAWTTIMAEGAAADGVVLVLDGMVQVEAGGTALAELGPGTVPGERASLEQGRRTATVRALTGCRIVSYLAADLPVADLRELTAGPNREGQEDGDGGSRHGSFGIEILIFTERTVAFADPERCSWAWGLT